MKTAVTTGAGGGLGNLLVKKLEKSGITCVAIDQNKDLLNYDYHTFFECDFKDPKNVQSLCTTLLEKLPKIDYLFNVAGVGKYGEIEDLNIEDWNSSININLSAPFILIKNLLPLLTKSDDPLIMNFGSGMGVVPTAGRSAYCSSKFGLRGLSLSLSKEFENSNLDVVLLTLGSIMTNFGPGGLEFRKKMETDGKKYLDPNYVIDKVVEIMSSKNKLSEYVIYPDGYTEQ